MHDLAYVARADRLTRRLVIAGAAGLLTASRASAQEHAEGHAGGSGLSPAAALQRLVDGNARYVSDKLTHPNQGAARRRSLAGGQRPFATILACADSRVGPELIFDAGLGDLFVVRVAGNVVDDAVLGSIEYAVMHLACPLVMVLGHERCGAVTATVAALSGKSEAEDKDTKIGALADLIAPAVRAVPAMAPDKVEAVVVENARLGARHLLTVSRPLGERVRQGRLQIVSARYDLDDGHVSQVLAVKA
jgi:carbonic anhydrase